MLLFNIPISTEKVAQLISIMNLLPQDRVLDVGCGRGEFLIRLLEATAASGLGIDINPELISVAELAASQRVSDGRCLFQTEDIKQVEFEDDAFDLAICLGSTHAFGLGEAAYPKTLDVLTRVVRPGGQILIGEGYWKQPPTSGYLELLGDPVGIYHDHAQNVSFAEARGLVPLYAIVSNQDEWDHFEWSHRIEHERLALKHPDDPIVITQEKLTFSRKWRDGYLRWGRSTMGFGYYLFMKPLESF